MNITTFVSGGKTVVRFAKMVIEYLKDDYGQWLGLRDPVTIAIHGKGLGGINFKDDLIEIVSPDDDNSISTIQAFAASTHNWNGASVVKDGWQGKRYDDGRTEASLEHDLTADSDRLKAIAEANGKTVEWVSKWADKRLAVTWRSYGAAKGKKGWWLNTKTWMALNLCGWQFGRWLWKKVVILAFCISLGALISGCDDVPDGYSTTPDIHYTTVTNVVEGVR